MKVFIALLLVLTLVSCSASVVGPSVGKDYPANQLEPLTADSYYNYRNDNPLDPAIIEAIRNFSLDSSRKILTGEQDDNYSPLSLYVALAMATTGSDGQTAEQLYQTLGVPVDADALAKAMGIVNQMMNVETETGRITLANSIWNQQTFPFLPDYVKRITDQFQASLFEVDFQDEATGKAMSDWVAKQTNDLIQADFGDTKDFASVLLNTLYFKESWRDEFDSERTTTQKFKGLQGDVDKDFMFSKQDGQYIYKDGIEGIVLPFELSRMIILKKPGTNPAELLKENVLDLANQSEPRMISLSLPKFKFDSEYDLVDAMKQLGVTDAFDPDKADFKKMSDISLMISQIKQNSHIALDETGVEAAAMTAVVVAPTSAPMPNEEVVLTFDEPFLYIIESADGLPLFIGTVTQ